MFENLFGNIDIKSLREIFKKKTTSFLFFGILLMIFSMYFNYLKDGLGNIGMAFSGIIIILALVAQGFSWVAFNKNRKK